MPCIEDGSLSPEGKSILQAIEEPKTDAEVKELTGRRLFRVRISLRELMYAGLATFEEGRFVITDAGRAKLEEPTQ